MATFDILLDSVSIKEHVNQFTVTFEEESPFNSVEIRLNDDGWFDTIAGDLFGSATNTIPTSPRLEVKTGSGTTADTSQGEFFIERPSRIEDFTPGQRALGNTIWGRGTTALMDNPFTPQMYFELSQHFSDIYKLASAVVDYICELYGLTVYSFDIDDYNIYPDWAIRAYPIDIIRKIAGATDGYVRSTKDGQIWVKKKTFHNWGSSYLDVTGSSDLAQTAIRQTYRYPPEFVTRVKFTTRGDPYFRNFNISISATQTSLSANGSAYTTITAIVTDKDGKPVSDGNAITWSIDDPTYASFANTTTYTQTTEISEERSQASWFNKVSTKYPISQVTEVKLDPDTTGIDYYEGGSFDGNAITLGRDLPYNNSYVKITYFTKGYSTNKLTAGTTSNVETFVHGMIQGIRDSIQIQFGRPSYNIEVIASKSNCDLDNGETEVVCQATVEVDGQPAPSGTLVYWKTNLGTVTYTVSVCRNGVATTKLINSQVGYATVTATVDDGSQDGLDGTVSVYFKSEAGYFDEDEPPSAPTVLNATAINDTEIQLDWTDNSDDEFGFEIYRRKGMDGIWESVGIVGNDVVEYTDFGLLPLTVYYYKVLAYNAAGDSDFSNEAYATTFQTPLTAPAAPSSLLASIAGATSITLDWTDNSDNESGFEIQKRFGLTGEWITVDRVRADTVQYTVPGLISKSSYYFRVRAYNSAGNSAWSNEANISTPASTKVKNILFASASGTADPDDPDTYDDANTVDIASQTDTKPDMFCIKVTNNTGYSIDTQTVKAKLIGGFAGGVGWAAYDNEPYRANDHNVLPTENRGVIPQGGDCYCSFYWKFDDATDISYTITVVDATTEEAIANAQVTCNGETKYTNASGQVTFDGLEANTTYPVAMSATGYKDNDADDDTENDDITTQDLGGYDYNIYNTAYEIELMGDQF